MVLSSGCELQQIWIEWLSFQWIKKWQAEKKGRDVFVAINWQNYGWNYSDDHQQTMQFDICHHILASYGIACLEENPSGACLAAQHKGTWTKGFGSKWIHLNVQKTCVALDGRWNAVIFYSQDMLSPVGKHSEKASQDILLRGVTWLCGSHLVHPHLKCSRCWRRRWCTEQGLAEIYSCWRESGRHEAVLHWKDKSKKEK